MYTAVYKHKTDTAKDLVRTGMLVQQAISYLGEADSKSLAKGRNSPNCSLAQFCSGCRWSRKHASSGEASSAKENNVSK